MILYFKLLNTIEIPGGIILSFRKMQRAYKFNKKMLQTEFENENFFLIERILS